MMQEPPEMAGEQPAAPVAEQSESSEKTSVFIPKDALGGRQCKPGEKLSFKVKDVDQETGEVEAVVEGYDDKPETTASDTGAAIDAMPEDE